MKPIQYRGGVLSVVLLSALCFQVFAQEAPLGAELAPLLSLAKQFNPEFASMRMEAQAASERVLPAGALPDPKFRMELRDITKMGEQNPTLNPTDVGSTRYLFMQDVPWFGKRDLKRDIAELDATGVQSKAAGTWNEIASKIKIAQAQRYFLHRNEKLTLEISALLSQLEKVTQARYASGLAAQQDVIRAQIEQTNLKSELIALQGELRQVNARLNLLLARSAADPLAPPEMMRSLPEPAQLELGMLGNRLQAKNPLLFIEESRQMVADKNRELAYKNRYPDFTLGISPIQYQGAVKEWELMFEINIPLQQTSRRSQEREAEAMLSAAKMRREALSNQMMADLAENISAIEVARKLDQLATNSLLPQSELTFNSALAGYEAGKVDFSTLLEAQRQIRVARQTQIKAQTEAQIRLAEIEKLLGESL